MADSDSRPHPYRGAGGRSDRHRIRHRLCLSRSARRRTALGRDPLSPRRRVRAHHAIGHRIDHWLHRLRSLRGVRSSYGLRRTVLRVLTSDELGLVSGSGSCRGSARLALHQGHGVGSSSWPPPGVGSMDSGGPACYRRRPHRAAGHRCTRGSKCWRRLGPARPGGRGAHLAPVVCVANAGGKAGCHRLQHRQWWVRWPVQPGYGHRRLCWCSLLAPPAYHGTRPQPQPRAVRHNRYDVLPGQCGKGSACDHSDGSGDDFQHRCRSTGTAGHWSRHAHRSALRSVAVRSSASLA